MEYNHILNAHSVDFAPGEVIDGEWTVVRFLGEGTFGRVFLVKDSTGKEYALKLLKLWEIPMKDRMNLQLRFDREYETGLIDCRYLVHSHAKGVVEGNSYFVMDYCPGGDVRRAVSSRRLDLALVARHVMMGLRELHANGRVHRDLKPENVLLMNDDHAMLTDFGISGDQNNRLTRRGISGVPEQRFGTVAYMPPEQMNPTRDNATVLPTTDIYSFGVMMYRLLTNELPFGALSSPVDMVNYTVNSSKGVWNRKRLLSIPRGYEWLPVLEGCLVPDFNRRLPSADAVLELLPKPESLSSKLPEIPEMPTVTYTNDTSLGILLRVMQGEHQGAEYHLRDLFTNRARIITVGRANSGVWNHLGLTESDGTYLSRMHCTIENDAVKGRWTIKDGQFRIKCPIGQRMPAIFPCRDCTAACRENDSRMEWHRSLNGTFVNSREVTSEGMEIVPGDIISIGSVKLRVEGVSGGDSTVGWIPDKTLKNRDNNAIEKTL